MYAVFHHTLFFFISSVNSEKIDNFSPRYTRRRAQMLYFCTAKTDTDKSHRKMKALLTVALLIISNIFMTFAWYGHLKLQETKTISNWPLYGVILLSWGIALFEYCFQVPANRIGFRDNGGPFTLMQLKVIQEVITLVVFTLFSTLLFKGEALHWNHVAAFLCLIAAVYFVFMK